MGIPSELNTLSKSSDPFLLVDGDGNIVWHNESCERLLCLSERALLKLQAFLPANIVQQLLSVEHYAVLEAELTLPTSGTIRQTLVTIDIGSGDPDNLIYLIAMRSVTSESHSLARREESLATVAHDLKNPLGAIFGYADALLDTGAGQGLTAQQRNVISRIRSTAARSVDLVKNYQYLAQVQSAHFFMPATTIDLNEAVNLVIENTWRDDRETPLLSLNLSTEKLPVRIERLQLERVLSNLFSNALKYTPREGKIEISSRPDKDGAIFEINNSGPIIKPEELGTIFDRFRRASSSKGTPGSGLGLYIVKLILDAVGGSIEVASNEREGTTFRVRFLK